MAKKFKLPSIYAAQKKPITCIMCDDTTWVSIKKYNDMGMEALAYKCNKCKTKSF